MISRYETVQNPYPRRHHKRSRHRTVTIPLLMAGLTLSGFLLGRSIGEFSAHWGKSQVLSNPSDLQNIPVLYTDEPSSGTDGTDIDLNTDWNLHLINWEHPISQEFELPSLTQLSNNQSIDSRAYPDLQRMMDDARAAGYNPLICSSYRSWEKQEELFQRKVDYYLAQGLSQEEAEQSASQWVARPGTSEHQIALAVDIVDKDYQTLDSSQEERPVQQWLMSHCADYGFILRYPTDKSDLTGVNYEPWHYRYVGVEAAQEIMTQGICLEEYLNR